MPSPLTLFGLFMLPVFKLQMKIHTVEMSVRTSGKGTYEITDKVTEVVQASGISSGQVSRAHAACLSRRRCVGRHQDGGSKC